MLCFDYMSDKSYEYLTSVCELIKVKFDSSEIIVL